MKGYDILIHECSLPLDESRINSVIRKEIPEEIYSLHIFNKAYNRLNEKRYSSEELIRMFTAPRVFVRGHVPYLHQQHSGVDLIRDIEWLIKNCPHIYMIAFKDEFSLAKIRKHISGFVRRNGNLEEELGKEIAKGLKK